MEKILNSSRIKGLLQCRLYLGLVHVDSLLLFNRDFILIPKSTYQCLPGPSKYLGQIFITINFLILQFFIFLVLNFLFVPYLAWIFNSNVRNYSHHNIWRDAGVPLKTFRYYLPESRGLDFAGLMEDIRVNGSHS